MSWDKVWLLEGCPYYGQWFIDDLKSDLNNPNVCKFDSNSSADEIKSALTIFPFFESQDLVIINNPDVEVLNACLSVIDKMSVAALVITCFNNTFDARQSFVSKANKNKRLKSFSYFEQGDDLSNYMQTWKNEISFSKDCLQWINKNAPTKVVKAKLNGQKKEIIVVDLLKLDNELNKIYSVYSLDKKQITIDDLKNYCTLDKEAEIWALFDAVIDGNLHYLQSYFDKHKLHSSNEGFLWVISSQLELYLQIKMNMGGDLSEKLTLKDKLNYYLSDNLEYLEETKPKPILNPYRLKIANETCAKVSSNSLIDKYIATICAIMDLRAGLWPDLVSSLLCLAYSGKNTYLKPVYDV